MTQLALWIWAGIVTAAIWAVILAVIWLIASEIAL